MPLSLMYHSALALFAQRTRILNSAWSIGFCGIWVCISSSSIQMFSESWFELYTYFISFKSSRSFSSVGGLYKI
jgi:uncharacterized membrane protein YwaF